MGQGYQEFERIHSILVIDEELLIGVQGEDIIKRGWALQIKNLLLEIGHT